MAGLTKEQFEEIENHAKALEKAAKLAGLPGQGSSPTKWVQHLGKIKAALANLEEAIPYADGLSVSDFIDEFGAGIVDAQSELDKRSKDYLNQLKNQDEISAGLPSLFRIPKATAELSFSLEYEKSRGFNVFVFGKKDTRTERQQQRIKFDIVAAPPPAELLEALSPGEAEITWVLNPLDRSHVEGVLENALDRASNTERGRMLDRLKSNF
ncbi:MAG: hypothetical protein AAGA95_15070, partial [Pseudomonadota bacterium]